MNNNNLFQYHKLPNPNASCPAEFLQNIEYLESKIDATTRELSYWDMYKISDVLTTSSEFQSSVNKLLPYSSLVINTTIVGDTDYFPGDIIVKRPNGNYDIIRAERGGIFYPSEIVKAESTYTYDFTFSYKAAAPSGDNIDISVTNNKWTATYRPQITFKGLTAGSVGSPYNKVLLVDGQGDNKLQATIELTASTSAPIVKCFTQTATGQWEDVYCDFEITKGTNIYTITINNNNLPTILDKVVIK